jgi:hypothetical protein
MKTNETENPIVVQRKLEAEVEKLRKINAHLLDENHRRQLLNELGTDKSTWPPELAADVQRRQDLGLDETRAIECSLIQFEHNKKLAVLAQKDAAARDVQAEAAAEIERQTAKEQAVLAAFTKQVLESAKAAATT